MLKNKWRIYKKSARFMAVDLKYRIRVSKALRKCNKTVKAKALGKCYRFLCNLYRIL